MINQNISNDKKLMRIFKILLYPIVVASVSSCIENAEIAVECDPCTSPLSYDGYTSIFSDEFNSTTLSENWNYVEGDGCPDECGWGLSEELEFYTPQNVELREGNMVITAKKENKGESLYTSGNINTLENFSFTYGRVDIRAKLPKGQGIWPAFWLLGDNINEAKWPIPGHISVAEMKGGDGKGGDNSIVGKLIWGTPTKVESATEIATLKDATFNEKFHVFSIIWEPTRIQWLLNDKVYFEQKTDAAMNGTFNKLFHLNIKLAVGGNFPGNPDGNTVFPQQMYVDYVRVFQKELAP